MKKIIALTGAGISAESGIRTFRDQNGLWENHDIMEVASPQGWAKNPELVLQFYNARRNQLKEVEPNGAHKILTELEEYFDVQIITQNVDDLHERAGSSNILHLHGELKKSRSERNEHLIYNQEGNINLGDLAEDGAQLRPHIVWFGEQVPILPIAAQIAEKADIFIIIGTSLEVYPAASLYGYAPETTPIFVVNPERTQIHSNRNNIHFIEEKATVGMEKLKQTLLTEFAN